MYLTRTPRAIQALFTGVTWRVPNAGKELYLTFDDGPIPEVTPWVLETLAQYGAKATFFCVGRNADAHPDLLARVKQAGHAIGNHTYDHVRGRSTTTCAYLRNALLCQDLTRTNLFRPPYGSLTIDQLQALRRRFNVVLWDVLSGDFDSRITGERCLRNVIGHARSGSIVVFHDSLKAQERLRYALPRTLAHFTALGYRFKALQEGPR